MTRPVLTTLPVLLALAHSVAHATPMTMDIPFDLSTGTYNPAYGDTFYNAPGLASVPNPVTLRAGDSLHLNYHYLPGQALQIQRTTGASVQQVNFNFTQDFVQGVMGTFTLSFQGVAGQLNSNSYTGALDGQNSLFVIVTTPFTNSAFSFTGVTVDMQITGMRDSYYSPNPAPTFTTNLWQFQAYGDHVLTHAAASVPDGGSTLALSALALAAIAACRRRLLCA